jgi:hypothetical protein
LQDRIIPRAGRATKINKTFEKIVCWGRKLNWVVNPIGWIR